KKTELAGLGGGITGPPTLLDAAVFHHKPLHGNKFIGFSGGRGAAERTAKGATLSVAHRNQVSFGDHGFNGELHGKGFMELPPDRDDKVHVATAKDALDGGIGRKYGAQGVGIAAIEGFDILGDDLLI